MKMWKAIMVIIGTIVFISGAIAVRQSLRKAKPKEMIAYEDQKYVEPVFETQ